MRRKRRSQGTWFPTIGSTISGDAILAGRQFSLTGVLNNIATQVLPVTYDVPQFNDATPTAAESLSELIGNEYIIKRLVGKLHIMHEPFIAEGNEDINVPILVGAGFFVARAGDPAGPPGGADQPIGASVNLRDNYSPLDGDNIREPWMWRRTWVLGTPLTQAADAAATNFGAYTFPPSTAGYGSVLDGPHFDVKSQRRVRQEDRLWFGLSVAPFFPGTSVDGQVVRGYLDIRIFGQLRKAQAHGAF